MPHGLRELAYATPLWHGVDLMRGLTLGTATPLRSLVHIAYFVVWIGASTWFAYRAYRKKLDRVTAFALRRTRGHLLLERNLLVYRHAWMTIFSGFFEPLFYLFSLGLGLGHFVGRVHGVSYASYIAPALLASSAMNGALNDAMTNVFWKLRYMKVYDSVLSTPLGPDDVAFGETAWAQFRGFLYTCGFLVTVAALGLIHSWWGIARAAGGDGRRALGFAGIGIGASTFIRTWQDLDFVQLVQLPMFLFSATFYPLSVYPHGDPVGRPLLAALPRDQPRAVVHARAASGALDLVHAGYLVALGAARDLHSPAAAWPGSCSRS